MKTNKLDFLTILLPIGIIVIFALPYAALGTEVKVDKKICHLNGEATNRVSSILEKLNVNAIDSIASKIDKKTNIVLTMVLGKLETGCVVGAMNKLLNEQKACITGFNKKSEYIGFEVRDVNSAERLNVVIKNFKDSDCFSSVISQKFDLFSTM